MKLSQLDTAIKGSAAIMVAAAASAEAQDLQGVYGGLSYTRGDGEVTDGNDPYSFDGNAAGAFVGYNHIVGDWLFGAELAYSSAGYTRLEGNDGPYLSVDNMRDIKARIGRVFGKTLVYGVVGRSDFDFTVYDSPPDVSNGSATAFGLGFEVQLGQRSFVGAEYLTRRDLNLKDDADGYASGGSDLNTLSLRVGLRF